MNFSKQHVLLISKYLGYRWLIERMWKYKILLNTKQEGKIGSSFREINFEKLPMLQPKCSDHLLETYHASAYLE